jgi:hypothetical protein
MKILQAYYKTIRHYFKDFFKWMDEIPDWRESKRIKYSVRDMIGTGLMIFLLKLESRRGLNEQRGRGQFEANVRGLLHVEGVAHGDSLNKFLSNLDNSYLQELRRKMIHTLLRNKVLDKYRLLGKYVMIGVDGTRTVSFRQPHCSECLTQKLNNGETLYYHPVLEAKILCYNGMSLSIGTEFIRNTDGQKKQDCELKAFYRLARRLKQEYPKLLVCLLGDSLYACEPVFELCEELKWKYLIVLKEERLTTIWEEVEGLRVLQEDQEYRRCFIEAEEAKRIEQYRWTLSIEYHEEQKVNVLEYLETFKAKKVSQWAWVSNIWVSAGNCIELSQGGRLRWKIENEGFNVQKNQGYELEHIYSYTPQAQNNFYLLMQIGHLINQLVEKGSLVAEVFNGKVPSLKTITRELMSQVKSAWMPWQRWSRQDARGLQIRLDSS